MQTLAQFIAKWQGKPCDFDGYYGTQCVDLADFYLRDVWGVPVFYVTGAVDLFGHRPDLIEWIANDPKNVKQTPQRGDLVIWHLDANVGTGVNGHVDIFLSHLDDLHFDGFDANWPVGSFPHSVHHTYQGVRGWGRRRAVVPPVVKPPVVTPIPPPPASLNLTPQQAADLVDWMSHITEQRT